MIGAVIGAAFVIFLPESPMRATFEQTEPAVGEEKATLPRPRIADPCPSLPC
jgi:hypothetical protein